MDLQGFIVTEFEVDRIWKGLDGESRVTLTQSYDSCTMIFEPLDEGYLVYGYVGPLHVFDENNDDFVRTEEVYLQPSVCSRGGPLNRAAEDLEALGEPSITSVNAILWAQIKALPVAGWR
jgi:hypothetical protein